VRLFSLLATAGLSLSAALIPITMPSSAQAQGTGAASRPAPSAQSAMVTLVEVMARRIEIGDTVAAAKWGTPQPIDDPAREKVVVDTASSRAPGYGVDPAEAVRVFSDQIAASKVVQYGLFSRWTAHPEQAPTDRPDLARIRPVLDGITGELLTQLHATEVTRAGRACRYQLLAAEVRIVTTDHLDGLHREALRRASTSICD
jgi:chorismate mutase